MSDLEKLLKQTQAQTAILITIRNTLERLAQSQAPLSPNYRRRLSEFPAFDWDSIDATVVAADSQGVAEVEWSGHRFDRRGGNKFGGDFIIFSRPAGEEGNYYTLIKFADYSSAPLVTDSGPAPSPARHAPHGPASVDARQEFYGAGQQAVRGGQIEPAVFNSLASLGRERGYDVALQELQAEVGA